MVILLQSGVLDSAEWDGFRLCKATRAIQHIKAFSTFDSPTLPNQNVPVLCYQNCIAHVL